MILFGYVILTLANDLVFSAPGDKAGSSTIRTPGGSWKGTSPHDSGGAIVFPDSKENDGPKESSSLKCPGGQKFCEDQKAKEILSRHLKNLDSTLLERFESFFGDDKYAPIEENAIHTRIDGDSEIVHNMCESETSTHHPDLAQSTDKEWKVILNYDRYFQGVQTERCRRKNPDVIESCAFSGLFPLFHRTECVQKFALRKMVILDPHSKDRNKTVGVSDFLFPSCCACRVIETTPAMTRIAPVTKPGQH